MMFLITSCYSPDSHQSMNDLHKLEGNWSSYEGVLFNENWRISSNTLMDGEGFSLNGSDTVFYERLQLSKIGDSIYYRVYLTGGNVDFLLVEASGNRWLFVNPQNEFPKKIDYKLMNDSILNVVISDMEVNRKQKFFLKRKNNQ